MCGIAGWLGPIPDGDSYARKMVQSLRHRGPDAQGVKCWPGATLIHTRLSIIDLSPTGVQPMANEDESIWTVFNGEIYNHHDLRHDLESKGHAFRGKSDTEVLPHLYEEEGAAFAARLRGMFAIAIFDVSTRTLVLARDRFGIKPLFYAPGNNRLAFSSEIRALLELPGIDKRPDRQAIYDFAALAYIPAPETFYTGIRSLEPGEVLEARLDGSTVSWKTRRYHAWSIAPDHSLTLAQATDRADQLVADAVKRQLESDVPLGSLLSGGIDSSLISVAAQEALHGELRTFNVRFSERQYDETWAAQAVAKHINSRHEVLDMDSIPGTWDHITNLLRFAGQPFADTSLFAVNAVCQLMRRHVTVAISGDGGDEGFGGYDAYWRLARIARWQQLPGAVLSGASRVLGALSRIGAVPGYLPGRIGDMASADDTSVIRSLFCFVPDREHRDLCRNGGLLPVSRLFERKWEHDTGKVSGRLERLSAHATEVNARLVLPNDFLFKVDIASMKESLEVRVPMLDEDLFAFGLSLPHRLKVDGRTCKMTLRSVAARRLPPAVASKPKWGFSIPLEMWAGADLRARLREVLLGPASTLPEYFHPEMYKPMIDAFCAGRPFPSISTQELYPRMVTLLSVHLALSKQENEQK